MGNHLFDLIKARMPAPTAPFAFLDDGRTYSYADMVAVKGDPTVDVTLLEAPAVVIQGGAIVKGSAL